MWSLKEMITGSFLFIQWLVVHGCASVEKWIVWFNGEFAQERFEHSLTALILNLTFPKCHANMKLRSCDSNRERCPSLKKYHHHKS